MAATINKHCKICKLAYLRIRGTYFQKQNCSKIYASEALSSERKKNNLVDCFLLFSLKII